MFKNYDEYAKSTGGGTSGCKECHNDTTLITGKKAAWARSKHGEGETFLRGVSAGCAGCHSGGGFSARVAAGQTPDQVSAGDPNPTPQDCRACHQVHKTYTDADWALETTTPVPLYAFAGSTFDGGAGNLCANCHQPRRAFPAATDGMVKVDSVHWGPHHGPQSAMLLGIGAALGVTGSPMSHYRLVGDTCVTCHMGAGANHTFEPNVSACQTCHAGAKNFGIDGTQTAVQGMLDELQAKLTAKGLLDADGEPVVGTYPEVEAAALWNWIYVHNEDKSLGVHNPAYTKALLQASLDALAD